MPRVARALADEQIYHSINRRNRRDDIFHDEYDFTKMLNKVACPLYFIAEQLGGWKSLESKDVFAMEYWELEQAKLKK